MNKIYKIVWNASLGAWVAVSEIAKGKTKTNSGTVGDVASNQKNEITLEKAFNYKALSVAVFTVLVPAFSFAAVGNNSIDTRLCAATAAAYSTGDIAVGCGSDSSGTNSIAIGGNATTKVNTGSTQGGQSIAIGYDAQTKGDQSVGLGANVRASGNSSIAIGGDDLNKVAGTNNNTPAAVTYKNLTGDNLIRTYDAATGPNSQYYGTTTGDGAVAIGVQASALGNLATSFGTRTQANGVASTALGVGATSDKDGSVALGAGSKTDGSATKVQNATVNGLGFTGFVGTSGFAGNASDAGRQVSVGNIGNERQIKNLAPGEISATSTDAINGSQIYAVTNTLIGQIQTTKSASPVVYTDTTGNKLTKASDGKWYLSTAVDAGGNKIGSPAEVLAANVATRLQDANGSTTTPIKLTNVADGTVAANSKDAVNGGQLKSVIDAQTATDSAAVKYDNAATKDKVTLGGATGTTITNVKDGALNATSTDAVNGRQLYATNQNVAQNTTSISTLNTTVSSQGTQITTNTADISSLKGGFTLQSNGANAGAIKAGDTVDIGVVDPVDTNLTVTKTGKNIAFALSQDLTLNSVTIGNTVINNAGITTDKVSVGNVVIDKTTNKITGIEAGTNSKDAVNKGQLDTLAAQQAATDSAAVKYDNAATKDKVTLGGATGTTITNVKDGALNATSTDAVNGRQLYATNQNVAQNTTSISTLNTTVSNHGTQITTNTADISSLKGGFTLQTNGANAGAIKAGDTVDIGVVDPVDTNLTATKTGKDIAFALSQDLSLTSVTIGNTVINNAGLTADKVTVGGVVLNKANNDITGLSNKSLSAADFATQGRAATEEQLKMISDAQTATDSAAVKYDNALTKDKVTLGGGAAGTTITNVKDGVLNASSTDAVNGRQLYATNQNVAQNTTSINALNTTVSNHGTQISTNTTDISTLKGGFTLQTNGTNAGAIKAGDTVDIGVVDPVDTNLTATKTGKDIAFALSQDLNLTSVTTGNTVINNAGLTADKVTVGNVVIDKTTNKITGIEAGTNSKDAVNKGQLDTLAAQQAATDSAAVKYDNAATKDKVSLGGATGTTITNVKDGALNATSTDAVNGRQLYATNQNVAQNTTSISTLNTTVSSQGTQISTNTADISSLKGGFTLQTNGANAGAIKAGDTVDIGVADPADSNLTATKTGKNIAFALSQDLNLTSVTTGNTVINNVGLTADKVTVGGVVLNKANNDITGLSNKSLSAADFARQGRAATEEQLKMVSDAQTATDNAAVKYDNAATKDKVTFGGTATSSTKDAITGKITTIGGTSLSNVASAGDYTNTANASKGVNAGDLNNAVIDVKTAVTNTGIKFGNGTTANQYKLGDTINVKASTDGSITSTTTADGVQLGLGNIVKVGSGATQITLDGTTGKIGGLSNKTWNAASITSGQAATEDQLKLVSDAQTATDSAAVKYDNAATKDKVTLGGASGTTISNVKAGGVNASSSDAINGSQLHAVSNSIKNAIGGSTTINAVTGAITTTNIGGTGANTIDGAINSVSNTAKAAKTEVKEGDNIKVTSVVGADGQSIYTVATAQDVSFDKVTVGSGATQITVDGSTGKIGGLSNKTWNAASITSGQAATEDQLKLVSDAQTATDSAAVKYDNAATKDKVTLGGGVAGTTITNVKDGALNASSTDAVNGRQLYATNQNVAQNTTSISTLNTTVSSQGTQISTNTADISTLKGGFTLQTNGANAGAIKAGDTVDIGVADPTDSNLTATKTGKNIAFALSQDLNLTSVTTGNTVINNAGLTADKVTVGNVVIDKTTNKITGIEAGTNSKDAVNKGQLDTLAAQQAATDSAAVKYDSAATKDKVTLGGTTTISTKDTITGKVTTTGGTSLSNVASAGDYTNTANASKGVNAGDLNNAVIDVKTAVTNTGIKFGNGTTANQYKLGDTINVKASTDGSITSTMTADGVQLGLGNTVKVGSGATQITLDGTTGKIGGLSNKTWNAASITSGQAATEDQLKLVSDAQTATDSAAVKYDNAATKDKVTLGGAAGTTISNVKAGALNASSSDAINGSQLHAVSNSIKNAIGGSTTINAATGAITTTNIGGTGANTIDGAINNVSNAAKAAKTEVKEGDNIKVTSVVGADGQSIYTVATAQDVSFDKVTVGGVVLNKANNDITGLSNKDLKAADFATKGRAATEEQLKQVISSNITEVVDASGNKVNIIDQVVNTKLDNTNQDSLFLTYNKQGQETTDRLTIGQTVQKMNTEGTKFFHTNADTSKGDLGTTNDSSASGLNSTAIGVNAIVAAGADSSVALGHNAKVQGAQSIAIGHGAEALGTQSISIGTGNKVKGNHSGAIGDPTIVNGNNSYSVGNNNQVLTDDTFVLGNNVTKTVAGSVVLGTGSAATTGAGVTGYALSTATNVDKTAINKTTSTTGAVAVGDAASGIYRQITGVAAGTQDADVVNVAQLKAVGNQVVTTQNSLVNSLGGNAKVNANGTITGPTYNVAKSTQTNVGDALDALDKAIESTAVTSKTTVTKGQNIVVNKSKNADGSDNYEIATAKDLTVDSVKAGNTVLNNAGITIGNNTVVLNNTGLIIAGGPSVTTQGINAGNKQITNVAAGTNATDAVNKGQLDSAINNVASDVTQLSNNAVKYDTASKDKITLGGANGTTITNVKNGAVVKDSKDAVNGGQLWTVQQQVNQNTNDIQGIQTSITNINNGKSGLVQQQTPNGDITVGKDAGGTTLNVSGTQGDRVVTGVKDGAINATSKDAVNGSQLNTTNNKVAEFLGGGAGYNNITNSFTNPTYKVDGKDYNNVGGAVDALNKADQALGNRITNLGDRLEQAFTETNQRIDGIEKKANAGIAAAMALEAAPFVAGKYTYAVGAAYHGGENAVGVTLRKTADNGRWSLTGGVAAASQGDPSVRIGISGVID